MQVTEIAATPDSSDAEDVQEAVIVLHKREGKVPLRNPAAQHTCHALPNPEEGHLGLRSQ